MQAARRKVLTMLQDRRLDVQQAEEMLDALEPGSQPVRPPHPVPDIVGDSPWNREFRQTLEKIAATHAPVLILGERGTGKALIARIIHYHSRRADGPFTALNCANAEEVIMDELFGREDGPHSKKGALDQAHGGTLLLDTIVALPDAVQQRLHAFLQDGYFTRVNGTRRHHADVRLMGASNHDFVQLIDQGRFRADLYYRLSVCLVQSAPLRQRREDIPLLTEHFLTAQAARQQRQAPTLDPAVADLLQQHHWPGNVAQLSDVITQAIERCDGPQITPDHLPELN
ncbi:MAG: hypothetical protein GKR89_04630 [Candidatus Latescibacteria bacterium]|nr:hypothetical protein [Candidatus Latescibacterota bacterium]